MGSSSKKELPPHKKEYGINSITLGKLWNWGDRMVCINCKSENVLAVVNYSNKLNYKQILSNNYCLKCLYFPLSVRWQAIYSIDIPLELKRRIFRRFMSVIT